MEMAGNEEDVMAENEEDVIIEIEEDVEEELPKLLITSEVWEDCLKAVKVQKEDMNRLVMNLLVTKGYREAVDIFQKESGTKPQVDFASFTDRAAVIEAILSGNTEEAIEKLNVLNPEIPEAKFHLKLQKFIDIVRKETTTTDEALAFATKELAPFGEQNEAFRGEFKKSLLLLCYKKDKDFSTCPHKELLSNSQLFKTATIVNEAMHTSQTGEKGSKLEHLLKMLIWTQEQLDEKRVYPCMSYLSNGQLKVTPPE
ncbi:GID8-like protein [Cardamine amara subsp. amara]|uniref:GID8-like protein n=1 Tax=Cardamine amara subsp. amara TaxID=228776 RepID=A0ABD1C091_CARAN